MVTHKRGIIKCYKVFRIRYNTVSWRATPEEIQTQKREIRRNIHEYIWDNPFRGDSILPRHRYVEEPYPSTISGVDLTIKSKRGKHVIASMQNNAGAGLYMFINSKDAGKEIHMMRSSECYTFVAECFVKTENIVACGTWGSYYGKNASVVITARRYEIAGRQHLPMYESTLTF